MGEGGEAGEKRYRGKGAANERRDVETVGKRKMKLI